MIYLRLPWPPSANHLWGNRVIVPRSAPREQIMSAYKAGRISLEDALSRLDEIRGKPFVQTYIGEAGKKFYEDVKKIVRQEFGVIEPTQARVALDITAHPPDRRARDISNLLKAIEDSLTNAGLWVDDKQVDKIEIRRDFIASPGYLIVGVERISEEPARQKTLIGAEDGT